MSDFPQPWTIYYDPSKGWWNNPYTITGPYGRVWTVASTARAARRSLRRAKASEEKRKRPPDGPPYWEGEVISP